MFLFKSNMYEAHFTVFSIFFLFASVQMLQLENPRQLCGLTKCFTDLGCFSNRPPFCDPINRPVLPLPEDGINSSFLLFNRPNIKKISYLKPNENSLKDSTFNAALLTKVIVHGFQPELPLNSPVMAAKDLLLSYGDYNVIIVNWTQSSARTYPQAVANGRYVGAEIAQLLQFLHIKAKLRLESVHLMCHSLGAHVCGWAGERLTNLGRITGTDPAGPYFYNSEDLVRLDYTDALFVDVIHTGSGNNLFEGVGLPEPIGHIDFYVNGGTNQPGCNSLGRTLVDLNITSRLDSQTLSVISCNHNRAPELFFESLNPSCSFIALACDSWQKFNSGGCNQTYRRYRRRYSAEMGFHAVKPENITISRRFYLKTNDAPPYCIQK